MNKIILLQDVYADRGPLLNEINLCAVWHAFHRRKTMELLKPWQKPGCRVLDLAAGTGIMAKLLINCGARVTLVDVLPDMLTLAGNHLGPLKNKAEFVCADLTTIALDRGAFGSEFDIVLLTQSANFLDNLEPAFQIAQRALLPGGLFHMDLDTAFRWTLIEALSGHVGNARNILLNGRDTERNIVGTEYYSMILILSSNASMKMG